MIRELKTLLAVAREGTFAAAGNKIGLTQAAVSAQMKRLESELGFSLFDRIGPVRTAQFEGPADADQAEELLRLYRHLGSVDREGQSTSLVNFGAIDSVQRSALPEVLARFHKEFPGCRTRVVPGFVRGTLQSRGRRRDRIGRLDSSSVHAAKRSSLDDARSRAVSIDRSAADVKQNDWGELLSTQPFVRYERAAFGGRQVDRFLRSAHITVRELCELGELNAIVRLVARGVGDRPGATNGRSRSLASGRAGDRSRRSHVLP